MVVSHQNITYCLDHSTVSNSFVSPLSVFLSSVTGVCNITTHDTLNPANVDPPAGFSGTPPSSPGPDRIPTTSCSGIYRVILISAVRGRLLLADVWLQFMQAQANKHTRTNRWSKE